VLLYRKHWRALTEPWAASPDFCFNLFVVHPYIHRGSIRVEGGARARERVCFGRAEKAFPTPVHRTFFSRVVRENSRSASFKIKINPRTLGFV